MRWVAQPQVQPYACSICGNGGERIEHAPFMQTDWTYQEDDGRVMRLVICAVCVNAMNEAEGSPFKRPKIVATTKIEPPRLGGTYQEDIVNAVAERVVVRLEERDHARDAERMARARAAKAARRANGDDAA